MITLTSTAFPPEGEIPTKYTCQGENINPPLQIKGVPESALSLVLVMEDIDVPGGMFNHWLLWDLSPNLGAVNENSVPDSARQGMNDAGKISYLGPCPPQGRHHYIFHIYALDTTLSLPEGSTRGQLIDAMSGHVVDEGKLVGTFEK